MKLRALVLFSMSVRQTAVESLYSQHCQCLESLSGSTETEGLEVARGLNYIRQCRMSKMSAATVVSAACVVPHGSRVPISVSCVFCI